MLLRVANILIRLFHCCWQPSAFTCCDTSALRGCTWSRRVPQGLISQHSTMFTSIKSISMINLPQLPLVRCNLGVRTFSPFERWRFTSPLEPVPIRILVAIENAPDSQWDLFYWFMDSRPWTVSKNKYSRLRASSKQILWMSKLWPRLTIGLIFCSVLVRPRIGERATNAVTE